MIDIIEFFEKFTSTFSLRIFDDKYIDIFSLDFIPISLYTRYMNTIYTFFNEVII